MEPGESQVVDPINPGIPSAYYNLAHAVRVVTEAALGTGLSLVRVRDHFLRVASRLTLHARRVIVIVADDVRERWGIVWRAMRSLDFAAACR